MWQVWVNGVVLQQCVDRSDAIARAEEAATVLRQQPDARFHIEVESPHGHLEWWQDTDLKPFVG